MDLWRPPGGSRRTCLPRWGLRVEGSLFSEEAEVLEVLLEALDLTEWKDWSRGAVGMGLDRPAPTDNVWLHSEQDQTQTMGKLNRDTHQ